MNTKKEGDLIPEGTYQFTILSAVQLLLSSGGEEIGMVLRIEEGPYEGRLVRFRKPMESFARTDRNETQVEFIESLVRSLSGEVLVAFPEWMGRVFWADVRHEEGKDEMICRLTNLDQYASGKPRALAVL